MALKTCQICGAEFTPKPRHPTQKYCSLRCQKKAAKRRNSRRSRVYTSMARQAAHALELSQPVSTEHIMRAIRKPANTSEVRWRIELRRRADAGRFALADAVHR